MSRLIPSFSLSEEEEEEDGSEDDMCNADGDDDDIVAGWNAKRALVVVA